MYARAVFYYNTDYPLAENQTGVAVSEIIKNTQPRNAGQPIVTVNIKLDNVMDYHSVDRKKYTSALCDIGGIQSFWLFFGMMICRYFTKIDYEAKLVKDLYLEKQTDEQFYRKYLVDDYSSDENSQNVETQ